MSEPTAEQRPSTPFSPDEGRASAPAAAADPLAGDWSEGLRSAVRALGIPLPRLLTDTSEPAPLAAAPHAPSAPADDSVEAPDAWAAAGEDPLLATDATDATASQVVELSADEAIPDSTPPEVSAGAAEAFAPAASQEEPAEKHHEAVAQSERIALPGPASAEPGALQGAVAPLAASASEAHGPEPVVELSAAEALESGVDASSHASPAAGPGELAPASAAAARGSTAEQEAAIAGPAAASAEVSAASAEQSAGSVDHSAASAEVSAASADRSPQGAAPTAGIAPAEAAHAEPLAHAESAHADLSLAQPAAEAAPVARPEPGAEPFGDATGAAAPADAHAHAPVDEAPQEVIELHASEALEAAEAGVVAAREPAQEHAPGAAAANGHESAARDATPAPGAGHDTPPTDGPTEDANAWATALATTLPVEHTDGGTPWSDPVAPEPTPPAAADPWRSAPIPLPAPSQSSVQWDSAGPAATRASPPADGTWAGATPADPHPAWGALAAVQAPPARAAQASLSAALDAHLAPAALSSDTPADPHPAWGAPPSEAQPQWSAAAPDPDFQQPADAPAWGAVPPAADWGAVSSGPDWSAAPAADAKAGHEGWGAPPPALAASEWNAQPSAPADTVWSAPAPVPAEAKPSWSTPAPGASTYDQLDAAPAVEHEPGAKLFAPLQHGESLSAEEPAVQVPAESDLELLPEDPDLLVPIEEEPEPVRAPAAELAQMRTVAKSSLAVEGEHRVAVHTRGGRTRRGLVKDIDLAKSQFGLQPQGGGAEEPVYHAEVKAIFFMMAPGEKPRPGQGGKVRVTFADGRTIEGLRDGADGRHGFFLVPSDAARTNTRRIYVAREAAAEIVDS